MTTDEPQVLGGYRLVRKLASEALYDLHAGVSEDESGRCAVVQRWKLPGEERATQRALLQKAANRARDLSHPAVMEVLTCDVDTSGIHVILAADSTDIATLEHHFERVREAGHSVPRGLVLALARELAAGLTYLHSVGDASRAQPYGRLCPTTALLEPSGQARLLGLGPWPIERSGVTMVGHHRARVAYQAPEQLLDEAVDARADIFALGVLLAEGLLGESLLPVSNSFELLQAIQNIDDQTVRARLARAASGPIPEPVITIVTKALARDPDARYQSAAAMSDGLDKFLASEEERWPRERIARWLVQIPPPTMRRVSADDERELSAGERIGRYEIERLIGKGGMGEVYLASDSTLTRTVAIKILPWDRAADSQLTERFLTEARAASRIRHQSIIQIFDFGEHRGRPYFAMEYLEGDNLRQYMGKHGRLSATLIIKIGAQIADALAAAHDHDVLHRDLKPDNVVLLEDRRGRDGYRVKVLDFGIAKLQEERGGARSANMTMQGMVMGTAEYMSPEQARDSAAVDTRSDVYSLGCMLYEMACGRPPYSNSTPMSTVLAHANDPVPDPMASAPDLPRAVADLIMAMLAKRAAERPQSMSQVCSELRAILDDPTASAPTRTPTSGAQGDQHKDRDRGDDKGLAGFVEARQLTEARDAPVSSALSGAPSHLLSQVLPPTMAHAHDELSAFVDALFKEATQVTPHGLRLSGAAVEHAEIYSFFLLLVSGLQSGSGGSLGQLGANTFLHSTGSLESHLRKLDEGQKVVIAVSDAATLGPGVREQILSYRAELDALVVPMYVGEIRSSYRHGDLVELFYRRISDYHTEPDPYATVGKSPDSTQFFGMRAQVNALVDNIRDGTPVIAVTGPPGSGKSTLVAMAEYGLRDHEFVYVRCPATARRKPFELVKKIARAMPQPVDVNAQEHIDQAVTMVTNGLPGSKKTVLVLEDADWLITALAASDSDERDVDELRAMWSSLAEQCRDGNLTLVVTSIRGYLLSRRVLGDWDNPIKPLPIELPNLDRESLENLLRELGLTINLHYDDAAAELIYELSAGNVYTARTLCSRIVRELHEQHGNRPLAEKRVSRQHVIEAAEQLISLARTYDETVMPWLDDNERLILQLVASQPPRSPRTLQRALSDTLGEAAARMSFNELQNMGLVGARTRRPGLLSGRRHRVVIPLMERWISNNLEQPSHQRRDRRRRRLRYVVIGITLTALLAGIYVAWFQTGRTMTAASVGAACEYRIDHPDRGAPDTAVRVYVHRRCDAPPSASWSLAPVATPARIEELPDSGDIAMQCDRERRNCMAEVNIALLASASDEYRFALTENGRDITEFVVAKDSLATFKSNFEVVFQLVALLPLLLGLLLAFHRDVAAKLRQLVDTVRPERPESE